MGQAARAPGSCPAPKPCAQPGLLGQPGFSGGDVGQTNPGLHRSAEMARVKKILIFHKLAFAYSLL